MGVINFHCKMNEISTFPLFSFFIFQDFSTFRLLRSCVFHFLDLSFLGTPRAPILDPRGSHVAPIGSHLAPSGLSCWSLLTLWALIWPPLGYHLAPLGSHWFPFGYHGPHLGHILGLKVTIRPHTPYIINKTHVHVYS